MNHKHMTERQFTTLLLFANITQSLAFSPAQTTPMQEKLALLCPDRLVLMQHMQILYFAIMSNGKRKENKCTDAE